MTIQADEIKIRWGLTMDVVVEGIKLPFRLRVVTDSEDKMLTALSDFCVMITDKIRTME